MIVYESSLVRLAIFSYFSTCGVEDRPALQGSSHYIHSCNETFFETTRFRDFLRSASDQDEAICGCAEVLIDDHLHDKGIRQGDAIIIHSGQSNPYLVEQCWGDFMYKSRLRQDVLFYYRFLRIAVALLLINHDSYAARRRLGDPSAPEEETKMERPSIGQDSETKPGR